MGFAWHVDKPVSLFFKHNALLKIRGLDLRMIIIALILIHTQGGDHPEAPTCEILLIMRNIHVVLLPGLVWIAWVNKENQAVNLARIFVKGSSS